MWQAQLRIRRGSTKKTGQFSQLPPQFLVLKGICSSARAGVSALVFAAPCAAPAVPRQGWLPPSCPCSSSHNTTRDRPSLVCRDSSAGTQLHRHRWNRGIYPAACTGTAWLLLPKSQPNATSRVTLCPSPATTSPSTCCTLPEVNDPFTNINSPFTAEIVPGTSFPF